MQKRRLRNRMGYDRLTGILLLFTDPITSNGKLSEAIAIGSRGAFTIHLSRIPLGVSYNCQKQGYSIVRLERFI